MRLKFSLDKFDDCKGENINDNDIFADMIFRQTVHYPHKKDHFILVLKLIQTDMVHA